MEILNNFCAGFSKVLDFSKVLNDFEYNDSSNFNDMANLYSDALTVADDCKITMIEIKNRYEK